MSRRVQIWIAFYLWAFAIILAAGGYSARIFGLRKKHEEVLGARQKQSLIQTQLWGFDLAVAEIFANEERLNVFVKDRFQGDPIFLNEQNISNNPSYKLRQGVRYNKDYLTGWDDGHLILQRPFGEEKGGQFEMLVLDWEALSTMLLKDTGDFIHEAELRPFVISSDNKDDPRRMANLPVILEVALVTLQPNASPPVRNPWLATAILSAIVLLGLIASALLLYQALDLAKKRTDFVAGVTHDLRTPLTTLRLYTDMLLQGRINDEEKRDHYLQVISAETDSLQHLVDNVLTHASLEGDAPSVNVSILSWSEFWNEAGGRLAGHAERAGMKLTLNSPEGELLRMMTDPLALERIFFNLVTNSSKYAKSESENRIAVSVKADDHYVRVEVRDYGPGIPESLLYNLFEPFTTSRADSVKEGKVRMEGGLGLGLSISRNLARTMGGDLIYKALNKPENGARFVLKIPRVGN